MVQAFDKTGNNNNNDNNLHDVVSVLSLQGCSNFKHAPKAQINNIIAVFVNT